MDTLRYSMARLEREPYSLYYHRMLRHSKNFEKYVVDVIFQMMHMKLIINESQEMQYIQGEGPGGFEIKHDCVMHRSPNIYIETAELNSEGEMQPSGIYGSPRLWLYIIGDHQVIYGVHNQQLIWMVESGNYEFKPIKSGEGYLIPKDDIEISKLWSLRPPWGDEAIAMFKRRLAKERKKVKAWLSGKSDEELSDYGVIQEAKAYVDQLTLFEEVEATV